MKNLYSNVFQATTLKIEYNLKIYDEYGSDWLMLKEFCHFRIKLTFRPVGPVLIIGMNAFKYISGDNQVSKFQKDNR